MTDRELDDYAEADDRVDVMAQQMDAEHPGYLKRVSRRPSGNTRRDEVLASFDRGRRRPRSNVV